MDTQDRQHYVNRIAGIELHAHWEGKMLLPDVYPLYADFAGSETVKKRNGRCIDIELIADGDPPAIRKTIFSTGGLWTLYESDDCYIARWGLPDTKTKWEWSVATSHDFRTVRMYYSSRFYNEHPEKVSPLTQIHYPVDQFLLMNVLADMEGTVIHSAGGKIQGKGIIFPGISGAGKSTLSRMLEKVSGNRLFSDDRMIIRHEKGGWYGYGTPWSGDALIARNEKMDLDAIFFITQAEQVKIVPVSPSWALRRLLPVCSIPWYDKKRMLRSMSMCEQLIAEVPMYECRFADTPQAAEEICEKISTL